GRWRGSAVGGAAGAVPPPPRGLGGRDGAAAHAGGGPGEGAGGGGAAVRVRARGAGGDHRASVLGASMTSAPPGLPARPRTEPEAVIREARRRQHRRWLGVGMALAAGGAGVAAASAGSAAGGRPRPPGLHAGLTAPAHAIRPAMPPGLVLAGAATTVVMWPVGYPLFTETGGPPAYVADLGSGRLWKRQIPGIVGCDCRPYLIGVDGRLVYVGSGGITAIS